MTELSLRIEVEGDTPKTVKMNLDRFTVGRSPECDLHVPNPFLARRHAQFTRTSSGIWEVEDLNSPCGILLNQYPVRGPQQIGHGDVIQLGQVFLHVVLVEATGP